MSADLMKWGTNMNAIRQLLGFELVTDLLAAKVAQVVGYVIAIVVFVLATLKLATLQLTEVELFFGILLVLAVFSSMICGATLIRIEAEVRKKNDAEAG